MVVRVDTVPDVRARTKGPVSEATANAPRRERRHPFSREYFDYWVPLPDPAR
jgi:hypothetical protein